MDAAPERAIVLPIVAIACGVALVVGWRLHESLDVRPEAGLGYALGVAGLGAMTALLGYSARKRARVLRAVGPLPRWFQTHMLLGVVGPTLICFHADFEIGSTNASAAFVAMVLVATSGFLGRFVYTRVHLGLYGQRESLREVERRADASRRALDALLASRPRAAALLREFEARALTDTSIGLRRVLTIGARTRATRRALRREIRAERRSLGRGGDSSRAVETALRAHLAAVRRLAEFAFYERVLSLWHAIHLPLCFLLFSAAAIHVVAVHLY
jgi:hypothetical protein